MKTTKTIVTIQDVFAHFGVKYNFKKTFALNNKSLEKKVVSKKEQWACVEVFPGQIMFSVGHPFMEPVVVHLPCTPAALDKAVAKVKAA